MTLLHVLQLTTQQGITAGLEADQAAKLSHIDHLTAGAAALQDRLEQQVRQTEAADEAVAASQAELADRDSAMAGV